MRQTVITRTRAPLRLGLAGGGTDLSPYSEDFGGAVLNCTIDRYAYATIEPSPDGRVHFIAPDLNAEETFEPDLHAIQRATLMLHAGVASRMVRAFSRASNKHDKMEFGFPTSKVIK